MNLHQNQQVIQDKNGTLRFRENKIVSYILDNGGIDLNKIACLDFTQEDRIQFAQLIGYSVSGFGGLSYVIGTDIEEIIYRQIEDGEDPKDARIAILEEKLEKTKDALREVTCLLFSIAEEDLS